MKYIGRLLGFVLLGINACLVWLLWLCAYSPHFNPVAHPVLSCAGLAFPAFLIANVLFLCFWLVACRRYALLPLLGLLLAAGTIRTYLPVNPFAARPPKESIKVLSYNTMSFGGKEHTKEHPNPVLEYLVQSDADIICLQEYMEAAKRKRKDIDYALRSYPHKHYYAISGMNGLGCYSRYPILSARPVKYDGSNNGSIAYELKVGEDTVLVVNNHLESNKLTDADKEVYREMMKDPDKQKVSQGSRQLIRKLAEATAIRSVQADTIARLVAGYGARHPKRGILVCGDFNDSPVSYTHQTIGQSLHDAFVDSGNGFGISYNRNRFYFRIDHILLNDRLKAYRCTVDNTIDASDHYPIWCHVSFVRE